MSKNSDYYAIAQRYTTALFELAQNDKKLADVASELASLDHLRAESSDFNRLCTDPTVTIAQRKAAIESVSKKAKLSQLFTNFLHTLADNGRMDALPEIAREFAHRIHVANGELVAEVTSASPMKKAQQTKLEKMLKDHFGKDVTLEINVNENLLGGLTVRVDGQLIDASIAGRMQRLESHLNAQIQQIN